jgi:hypothetical protein
MKTVKLNLIEKYHRQILQVVLFSITLLIMILTH